MKKLLFLLLITVYGYGQTLPSPAYNQTTTNTLKIKTPATITSVNFLPAFDTDGITLSKINPVLLPLSTATINAINTSMYWTKTGNDIYNNNSGNVSIFTTPSATSRLKIGSGTSTDDYNTIGVSETITSNLHYNAINSEARYIATANQVKRVRGGKFVSLVDPAGFTLSDLGGASMGLEGVARVSGLGNITVATGTYARVLIDNDNAGLQVRSAVGFLSPQFQGGITNPFTYAVGGLFTEQGTTTRSTNTANLVLGTPAGVVGDMNGRFTGKWNIWSESTFPSYFAGNIQLNNLTTGRVVVTDASKNLASSAVTSTELGYLSGVTSAIQTQINAKAPAASPTFTGTPTAPTAPAGTNTTQIATTAFVQSATRPYKSYTVKITQTGTSAPSATTLENQLGTVTWSYLSTGNYKATLITPIDTSKFVCPQDSTISMKAFLGPAYTFHINVLSSTEIGLITRSEDGTTLIDNMLLDKMVEFRVYN